MINNILDSIVEFYNKSPKKENGTFFKVKSDAFEIGKLLFSFVTFNASTGKQVNKIDFFIDLKKGKDGALVLCQDILSGKIAKEGKLEIQKRPKDKKYAAPIRIYQGGVSSAKAKEKKIRTDGKAQARILKISTGTAFDYIISCEEGPGHETKEGLIVPDYQGNPEKIIRVGINADDFKSLALSVQMHYGIN